MKLWQANLHERLGKGPAKRVLPALLALMFTWSYGFWLPLHLIAEPHHGAHGPAAHSHVHGHGVHGSHEHGKSDDVESGHEGEPSGDDASLTPVGHEHPSHAHQHPPLRVASQTPCVTVLQVNSLEIKTPAATKELVPTSFHGPPKLHEHSQASPRAPPPRVLPHRFCG